MVLAGACGWWPWRFWSRRPSSRTASPPCSTPKASTRMSFRSHHLAHRPAHDRGPSAARPRHPKAPSTTSTNGCPPTSRDRCPPAGTDTCTTSTCNTPPSAGIPTMLIMMWMLGMILCDFWRGLESCRPGRSDRKVPAAWRDRGHPRDPGRRASPSTIWATARCSRCSWWSSPCGYLALEKDVVAEG